MLSGRQTEGENENVCQEQWGLNDCFCCPDMIYIPASAGTERQAWLHVKGGAVCKHRFHPVAENFPSNSVNLCTHQYVSRHSGLDCLTGG